MSRSVRDYLQHILDECLYLESEFRDLEKAAFQSDETRKRAYVRSLEIIGEAAKNIPEDVRTEYPQIRWRSVAGMRDRLIHAYFGIDYDIVWDILTNHIPELRAVVESILARGKE